MVNSVSKAIKISFVIPAYNEEKYIGACLESVLKDTADLDAEIIVVNNASKDNTKAAALKYPGVKVVDEPQKGIVFARSAGAKAASGELIAHIDSDTRIPPGWSKKAIEEFLKNKNLVGLSGPYIMYDFSAWENFLVEIFYYLGYIAFFIGKNFVKSAAMLQGGNIVVKKSAWDALPPPSSAVDFYGEDTDIALRLKQIGEVKFDLNFNNTTSGRRLRQEGILRSGWRYFLNYLSIVFFKKPYTKKYTDVRPT